MLTLRKLYGKKTYKYMQETFKDTKRVIRSWKLKRGDTIQCRTELRQEDKQWSTKHTATAS